MVTLDKCLRVGYRARVYLCCSTWQGRRMLSSRRQLAFLLLVLSVIVSVLYVRSHKQRQTKSVVNVGHLNVGHLLVAEKANSMRLRQHVNPPVGDVLGEALAETQPTKLPRSRRDETLIGRLPSVRRTDDSRQVIHVLFILKNSRRKYSIKFAKFINALVGRTRAHMSLHAIVDPEGRQTVEKYANHQERVFVNYYESGLVEKEIKAFVDGMRQVFSSGRKNYFDDPLFFVSPVLHRILPESVKRVIVLDVDVELRADIVELASYFNHFKPSHVVGLAHEAQPVYRHLLTSYRQAHPGTRIGNTAPRGVPGFNSGVILQDLERIRKSREYRNLTHAPAFNQLVQKYSFRGHLGDQDFYTLISFDHEDLFFVLPCTWNRQLCRFWERGYKDIFMSYYKCEGKVNIYHGNCHTPIPVK